MSVANDNAALHPPAYGPTGVVLIEAKDHERPYWRMVRLPGVTIQYGYHTVRDAMIGEAARTLPVSGAAVL